MLPADSESVMLLTGDRVVLSAAGAPRYLLPGRGRERGKFTVYQAQGHHFVVPSDAMPLLAQGVLDERLFDVTELRAIGSGEGSVPVIVKYASRQRPLVAGMARDLPSINGAAINAGPEFWSGMTLARAGFAKIWLDRKRHASLDRSVPQIGAPAAWQAGYTGKGVTVAVLDTGVDETHPDLASREIGSRNFSGSRDNVDRYGHGTHVASIVAGTGAKSGGKYRGVAPDARILDVKVLADNGYGSDSAIISGMQWAAEQGAGIVNMSFEGFDDPGVDPVEEAVNTLTARYGTLFVIAAGNFGPSVGTISSPGSADAALTVGAVDRQNQIAASSSRGPREGGGMIKPDITGPGVGIVAALHADGRIGEPVAPGYTALSGTSMATPHVSGAAALLAQQRPGLTGPQLKAHLVGAGTPTAGLTPFQQGAGRVDSAKAMAQTVSSNPTNVNFGTHQWPHTDEPAVTQEITYTNDSTAPVTLELRMDATGPSGLFTISPTQLVVPARGSATATAKADVRNAPDGGEFGGALVATGPGFAVRTPVVADLEVESYDLVLNAIDRTGGPADFASAFLINADTGDRVFPNGSLDGRIVQRLVRGRYLMSSTVLGSDNTYDVLNYPDLTVAGPMTIDLDARLGKPVKLRLPEENAALSLLQVGFERVSGPNRYTVSNLSFSGNADHIGLTHLGPDSPEVTGQLSTTWAVRGSSFYGLAWYAKGRTLSGIDKTIRRADLASVRVDVGPLKPGQSAQIGLTSAPHGRAEWVTGSLTPVNAPGVHTEYFGGANADWSRRLNVQGDNGYLGVLNGPPKHYTPGRWYTESFYRGVFGPVFPDNRSDPWVQLRGDTMIANLPLFGDGFGNAGWSSADSASTKLYRNEQLLSENGETGYVRSAVPQGTARYRLTAEAKRTGYERATSVSAAWTFQADPGTGVRALPVSVVRYTPRLDSAEKARAGSLFIVPVEVQTQAGAASSPRITRADVSFDRGATWQAAPLIGAYMLLYHPYGAESVSLRARASDRDGNSVEQTIIDAYLLH